MPWCVRANELVADAQLSGGILKQGRDVPLRIGKTVGKLKAIVGLNALNRDTPASIPLDEPFEEIGRGVGGLLRVGGQEAQAGKFVDGSVLVSRSSGSATQRRGTIFTSTWTRWPG